MKFDYGNVSLNDGFWHTVEDMNARVSINEVWNRFEETGRVTAFKHEWNASDEEYRPHVYWDSDIFKWMEGACNIVGKDPTSELRNRIDSLID